MKQFDAAVIGAMGVDTNIYFYGNGIDFDVEANFTQNYDMVGCAGGYSSRLFNNLGYRTAALGEIGNDFAGNFILKTFRKDGIDTSYCFEGKSGTRRSVNFMYPDGRRKNFYDGKHDEAVRAPQAKSKELFAKTKLCHFSIVNWARHLLAPAEESGCVISADLQDVVDVNDDYRLDFAKAADILFFSAANFPDPTPLMEKFLSMKSGRIVVCGRGKEGCALGSEKGIRFFDPVEFGEPVIDSNGAGDSLAVGFLSSYLFEKMSLEDSILRGQIAARHTCMQKGTTDTLIQGRELTELFKKMK